MAFNIQEFVSNIGSAGVQFNSHYDVMLFPPKIMEGKINQSDGFADLNYVDQSRIFSFRCQNATIPGIGLRVQANNRYGIGNYEKFPYGAGLTDINLVFLQDKNGFMPKFFYAWLNLIANYSDTQELYGKVSKRGVINFKDDYSTNLVINKYDAMGSKISTVVLTKAFPISMNEQPLAWQDNDVTRLATTFTFRDWYFEGSKTTLQEFTTNTPINPMNIVPNGVKNNDTIPV